MNFIDILNFKQTNDVLNSNNRLVDLILIDPNCLANRKFIPILKEDPYHPALMSTIRSPRMEKIIFFVNGNCNNAPYDFRNVNFWGLYTSIKDTTLCVINFSINFKQ